MKLLTQQDRESLPKLYDQEDLGLDATVHIKFFDPSGSWTWYATDFDGKDIFFGLVDGFEKELGYFSLNELQSVRGSLGIGIEKDLYFTPQPLKNFM